MVLVPHDAVMPSREQIEQTRSVQTPGTTLSRLDAEMDDILRSVTPANQREKWKLYQQVLQRHQFFVDEERRPKIITTSSVTDKPAEQIPEEAAQSTTEAEKISDEVIVASVPKTYRRQAEQLLNHLRASSNTTLTWDKSGVVHINGEPIKESNIIDLVNDTMRHRKTVRAIGREQFGNELRRLGIPREFIGNTSLLYESLNLNTPVNSRRNVSNSNPNTPDTSQNSLNLSGNRRRTPTSDSIRSWKTLKL